MNRLLCLVITIMSSAPVLAHAQEWAFWAHAKPVSGKATRTALPVYFHVNYLGPDSVATEERLQRQLSERLTQAGFEVLPASIRRDNDVGDHIRVDLMVFSGGAFAYRMTTTVYCRGTPSSESPGQSLWQIRESGSQSSWTSSEGLASGITPPPVDVPDLNAALTCERRANR